VVVNLAEIASVDLKEILEFVGELERRRSARWSVEEDRTDFPRTTMQGLDKCWKKNRAAVEFA
jgi:hypothetical protein